MRKSLKRLFAVLTDGVDRAALEGFHALIDTFLVGWLGEDVGVAAIVLASEGFRGGLAAKIAVDALRIHVELAGGAFGTLVVLISHSQELSAGGRVAVKNARQFAGIITTSR